MSVSKGQVLERVKTFEAEQLKRKKKKGRKGMLT